MLAKPDAAGKAGVVEETVEDDSDVEDGDAIPLQVANVPFFRLVTLRNTVSKGPASKGTTVNAFGPPLDSSPTSGGGATPGAVSSRAVPAPPGSNAAPGVELPDGGFSPTSAGGAPTARSNLGVSLPANSSPPAGSSPQSVAFAVSAPPQGTSPSSNGRRDSHRPQDDRTDPLPPPLTFDPRSHVSWVDERKQFARLLDGDSGLMEICTIDRNDQANTIEKTGSLTRICGFISTCAVKYSRALGIVLAIGTEKGYLGDSYLYIFRVPQTGSAGSYLPATLKNMRIAERKKAVDARKKMFKPATHFAKKPILLRETHTEQKWRDVQISTDCSRVVALDGDNANIFVFPNWIEEEHMAEGGGKKLDLPILRRVLEIEPKYMRRIGQEDEEDTKLFPQRCCFFSELALFGSQDSAILGLRNGSLVKLNYGEQSRVG